MDNIINTRCQEKRRTKEELIKHLNTFNLDIKISIGIWYFTPIGGRFHEAYVENKGITQRIEMAAEMAKYGVQAIEAHYPSEVNEENYYLYKKLEKESGILESLIEMKDNNEIFNTPVPDKMEMVENFRQISSILDRIKGKVSKDKE